MLTRTLTCGEETRELESHSDHLLGTPILMSNMPLEQSRVAFGTEGKGKLTANGGLAPWMRLSKNIRFRPNGKRICDWPVPQKSSARCA